MLIYACGKLLLACVLFLAVLQSAESVGGKIVSICNSCSLSDT